MTHLSKLGSIIQHNKQSGKLVSWAFASQVLTSGSNFATAVLLIRALGLEGFGQYSLAFLSIMIARAFLDTTVLVPMSSIAPKLKAGVDTMYRGFAGLSALGYTAISSIFISIIFAGASILGVDWLSKLAIATGLANGFANLSDFIRRYFFVYNQGAKGILIDVTRYSVQLSLLLIGFSDIAYDLNVNLALLILAGSSACGVITGLTLYGRIDIRRRFSIMMWGRHWQFSRWMFPSAALSTTGNLLPMIIATWLLGEAALGLIRAVETLANLINLALNTLQQIAPSMATQRYVSAGQAGLKKALTIMGGITSAYLVAASLVLLLISDLVIIIFMDLPNTNYQAVLVAFIILKAVLSWRQLFITYYIVLEQPRMVFYAMLSSAIISNIALCPIIYFFGVIGVPISFCCGAMASILTLKMLSNDQEKS